MICYEQVKAFLTKLPEVVQYPVKGDILDPVMLWLLAGVDTEHGIGDDPETHQRDISRLMVLTKLALHASHTLLPCNGSVQLKQDLVGVARWCIDRAIWCSDAEDHADEFSDPIFSSQKAAGIFRGTTPPEGVIVVGLDDPAVLHNTLKDALGE